ncbi:MAG: Ig-like domain-containing protein, partial [Cyclobacteriaceae bacterium]
TVNEVNDVPVFTIAADPATINEDAGLQTIANFATAIDEGGSTDEDVQTLTFNVTQTSSTGNLAFANIPAISESGELTYSATDNTNGTTTFSVTLSDDGTPVATSAAQTFTITVNEVNDVPTFSLISSADQVNIFNSGVQTISNFAIEISSGGGSDESGQLLNFVLTTDNDALFIQLPSIDAVTGDLQYTIAPDFSGLATVTVVLSDNGEIPNTSKAETFTIEVLTPNNAPSFTAGATVEVLEDAGTVEILNWATAITDGDDETQTLTFTITENSAPELFSVSPEISEEGTLTFTTATDQSGTATLQVILTDDGRENTSSAVSTFDIVIKPVNDEPTIDKPADLVINAGESTSTILSGITTGTSSESQTISISVTTDRPDLITDLAVAYISPQNEAVLTFNTRGNVDAIATITVTVTEDNGNPDLENNQTVTTFLVELMRIVNNELFIPTLFSPNNDGQNDRFRIRGEGISDIVFSIYDTEGIEVYRTGSLSDATQSGWDGTIKNGNDAQPDTYIWVIKGSFENGSSLTVNGENTGLIRLVR